MIGGGNTVVHTEFCKTSSEAFVDEIRTSITNDDPRYAKSRKDGLIEHLNGMF